MFLFQETLNVVLPQPALESAVSTCPQTHCTWPPRFSCRRVATDVRWLLRISSFAEGPAAVVARGRSVAAEEGKGPWLRQADAVGGVNSAREQASSVGGGTGNNFLVHMEEGVQVYRWKWEETSKVKERHGKGQSEEASNEGTNAQPLTMRMRMR